MRIIAGRYKGRHLKAPTWPGLRPTSDKLRETLFNVLAPRIEGARVLDGYAGTGAIGIEALSRGAAHVTFVDKNRRAVALIEENLKACHVEGGYTIRCAEVAGALDALPAADAFDLILLDPPYDIENVSVALAAAARRVTVGGLVVLERASRREPEAPAVLRRTRDVKSGDSTLTFYTSRENEMPGPPQGRLAIFPGSFDPLTNGHVDIILRSAHLFERIIVAVLVNAEKNPLFTSDERVAIIKEVFREYPNIEVDTFDGLLVDYARRRRASALIRGLRAVSDFEYEFQMALMNRHLEPTLETVFMMPAEQYTYLSSRLIKEVFSLGGEVHGLVPSTVEQWMRRKTKVQTVQAVQ